MLPLVVAPRHLSGATHGAATAQNGANSHGMQQENAEMIDEIRGMAYHAVSVAPMLDWINNPVITWLAEAWRNFWRRSNKFFYRRLI